MLRQPATLTAALLILVSVSLAAGCSKSDNKATNPYGGGGGTPSELNSGDLANGAMFPHQFLNPGTFNYHCLHHDMHGTVVVMAGFPATAAVSITNNAYTPMRDTVGVGANVTWTNNSGAVVHTVTSE